MNTLDPEAHWKQLHALYCQLTGCTVPYDTGFHASDWYLFSKRYDEADLKLVVPYLRSRYRDKPDILTAMLRFRHLIRSLDYFGEYLSEANSQVPKHPMTDREWVLRRTGRECAKHDPAPAQAKTPEQILRESQFVATHMAEFRKEMGYK